MIYSLVIFGATPHLLSVVVGSHHLRCHIGVGPHSQGHSGQAAVGTLHVHGALFWAKRHDFGNAKVRDFHVQSLGQEQVQRFQISMDHWKVVKEGQGTSNGQAPLQCLPQGWRIVRSLLLPSHVEQVVLKVTFGHVLSDEHGWQVRLQASAQEQDQVGVSKGRQQLDLMKKLFGTSLHDLWLRLGWYHQLRWTIQCLGQSRNLLGKVK